MQTRYPLHPTNVKRLTTDELRQHFQATDIFVSGQLNLIYTHIDRVIFGGAVPTQEPLELEGTTEDLGTIDFLERRELGVINLAGDGHIMVDGHTYQLARLDGLYIGQGTKDVVFSSADVGEPARFYIVSTTAHTSYPTTLIPSDETEPLRLGDAAHSNQRTIYKCIHPEGVKSCQLVMGFTQLEPNNMWNTMPPHVHSRRMEVYLYFDIPEPDVVFHLMGEPSETRHLVIRNEEAVISPSWSIHAGMGTTNYAFIWAMAGENQDFTDMDAVTLEVLR